MTDHPDQQCGETPLLDLLSYVPTDARMIYNHGPTHSQSIPVGVLCQRSAAEITRLRAEAEALRRDAERLNGLRMNLHWDGHAYWLPDLCIKEREGVDEFTPEPTPEEFRAAIDAATAATKEQQA